MKKIILLFLLFTLSLFCQFAEVEQGFIMKSSSAYSTSEITCYFSADYENNRILITIDTDTEPFYLQVGDFEIDLQNDGEIMQYEDSMKSYVIFIYDRLMIATILQEILKNRLWISFHAFDFREYKNDIKKSSFYKKYIGK